MTARLSMRDVRKTFHIREDGRAATFWEALGGHPPEEKVRHINAVSNVSLDLHEGDRLGIIGRNGAGKSTLLQMIAGVLAPSSGEIAIEGRVNAILTLGAMMRPEATGRENIFIDAAMNGRPREQIEASLESMIAFADLGEFIDRPVRTYSTGMRSRLAFAMAAFIEPEILIVDEALSVGDVHFAQKADAKMRELALQGKIVVIVTHNLWSIRDLCTRCIWMDEGAVVLDGAPETVVEAYLASVAKAEESELLSKFTEVSLASTSTELAAVDSIVIGGVDATRGRVSLPAMRDAVVEVGVRISSQVRKPDVEVLISRVDGEQLWASRLSRNKDVVRLSSANRVRVTLAPFMLGAHLYRIEARVLEGDRPLAARASAFEVVDEAGQFGGVPMLFWPPRVSVKAFSETVAT